MSTAHVLTEANPFEEWRPVIREVCARHGVAWREVVAGYRDPRVVACRHEIWAELHRRFQSSYATIGKRCGGFHASSVLAAVHKLGAADGEH